jgi:hypothetical protein
MPGERTDPMPLVFLLINRSCLNLAFDLSDVLSEVDRTEVDKPDESGSGLGGVVETDDLQLLIVRHQTLETGSNDSRGLEM